MIFRFSIAGGLMKVSLHFTTRPVPYHQYYWSENCVVVNNNTASMPVKIWIIFPLLVASYLIIIISSTKKRTPSTRCIGSLGVLKCTITIYANVQSESNKCNSILSKISDWNVKCPLVINNGFDNYNYLTHTQHKHGSSECWFTKLERKSPEGVFWLKTVK